MASTYTLLPGTDPRAVLLAATDPSYIRHHAVLAQSGAGTPWEIYGIYSSLRTARRRAARAAGASDVAVVLLKATTFYLYNGPLKGR